MIFMVISHAQDVCKVGLHDQRDHDGAQLWMPETASLNQVTGGW